MKLQKLVKKYKRGSMKFNCKKNKKKKNKIKRPRERDRERVLTKNDVHAYATTKKKAEDNIQCIWRK